VTGLIFEKGNANSLADAIAVLLRDPERAARMGTAAREHAVRNYDYGAFVSAYEELYFQVQKKRGKPAQVAG
jgi:glycosyltransferase involved in cell wall biosynthesis